MKKKSIFLAGIIKENPILIMLLGLCPSLATTSSVNKAIGMGITFTLVLITTNVVISAIRKYVPTEIRIPVFIVIIATVVSIVEMVLHAYALPIWESLGLFLPLIVVNCVILGRAEAFASKNGVLDSLIDAIGVGIGFALALFIIAFFREFLSTGGIVVSNPVNNAVIFDLTKIQYVDGLKENGLTNFGKFINTVKISEFGSATGAFITLGFVIATVNAFKLRKENKQKALAAKEGGKK